jgi:hypothetical protein
MDTTLATRLALISGAVLLAFVLVGYVLAVTLLPAGGHQLGGLLFGGTDLGPPWLAVAFFVVALGLLPGKGWRRRMGALLMVLCGLGYAVAQLSSISTWFPGGTRWDRTLRGSVHSCGPLRRCQCRLGSHPQLRSRPSRSGGPLT